MKAIKGSLIFLAVTVIVLLIIPKDEKPKPQPVYRYIRQVIGATPATIKHEFGKPTSEKTKNIDCGFIRADCNLELEFKNGSEVVQFAGGSAYFFEFNDMELYKFNDNMEEILGLSGGKKKVLHGGDVVWYNYSDIHNVAFVESKQYKGFIDYVIVSVLK